MNCNRNYTGNVYKVVVKVAAAIQESRTESLQWIPGNIGLKGNEAADCGAKKSHHDRQYECVPHSPEIFGKY